MGGLGPVAVLSLCLIPPHISVLPEKCCPGDYFSSASLTVDILKATPAQ